MFLQIQGIQKSFGAGDSRVDVLKGLDLDIERGEFCVLLGPSGSGKSTLLNIIGGIDSADEGNLVIDGERLADMSEKNLSLYRRKHLGYIFQMYNLIPNLTVRENIEVGAYLSDKPLDVDELLHTLGIYEHQRKLPNQLSCSQQLRTANSFPEVSSRGYQLQERWQRIRSFCSVMSLQEPWIIIPPRKS